MSSDRKGDEDPVFLFAKGVAGTLIVLVVLCIIRFIWFLVTKLFHPHMHHITAQSVVVMVLAILGLAIGFFVFPTVADWIKENAADAELEEHCQQLEDAAYAKAQASYDQIRNKLEREYEEFRRIIDE